MNEPKRILQLCPHDSAPFADLVLLYERAAESLGLTMQTVILGSPSDHPIAGVSYLNCADLSDTSAISAALDGYARDDHVLVICHRYRSYWAAVRSALPNAKCVAVAHEYNMLARWRRRMNRRLFARRVRFAGVSRCVAQELAAVTGETLILPNGLDAAENRAAQRTRAQARQDLGLDAEDFVVGVVGRLHYKKRPDLALAAFQHFAAQINGVHLVFVGAGEAREDLAAWAGEQATFAGVVSNARHFLAAFDAILYPAVADSFGMVALEAMDAGVPVVCKAEHGPAEVLGELGFYVQQDTARGYSACLTRIHQLAPEERTDLRVRGRRRVDRHFSVAAVARALNDAIVSGG